jgi:hypothetical protein
MVAMLRWSLPTALGLLVLVTSQTASASDAQFWTSGSVTVNLSNRWALSQDITARFSGKSHGLYELETNTLLGFRVNKTIALWAGYDHDPQYSGGKFAVMEQRLVEVVTFDNFANLGPGRLSGRARLEQRWRDGKSGTAWRLRPYLRYAQPLRKKGKISLTISEEAFLDLNTASFQTVRRLERLRSFVGITAPLANRISADVGYMNQHRFVPNGKDTNDNIAYVSVGLKL